MTGSQTEMNHVFVSYRQESVQHSAAVRRFAETLRAKIPAVSLDQFFREMNPAGPNEGWRKWCEDNAEKSACVLIVCSKGWFDAYRQEGPPHAGMGAAWEAAIFAQEIYDQKGHNARIRLVNLGDFDEAGIPLRLRSWQIFQPAHGNAEFDGIAKWVRQRLAMPGSQGGPPKIVSLAECHFDMRAERRKLQAFLEDKGWDVRPASAYDDGTREFALRADLQEAVGFVQLLESYRRDSGFDRRQGEVARELGKKCFYFRDDKIVVPDDDPVHAEFLNPTDVVAKLSFEEFKVNVAKDLERMWEQSKPGPGQVAFRRALVQVAIRSANRDSLWDRVFEWIDREHDIRSHLLEEAETFLDKHDPAAPCHGFLIVCDGSAPESGPHSPSRDMEHCSRIQLKEKDETRVPPAHLVYCPPPMLSSWSRLQRVTPLRFQREAEIPPNGMPGKLVQFFAEVRQVVR